VLRALSKSQTNYLNKPARPALLASLRSSLAPARLVAYRGIGPWSLATPCRGTVACASSVVPLVAVLWHAVEKTPSLRSYISQLILS
jgi:hypothetical protein